MQLALTAEHERFRSELREFLAAEWHSGASTEAFRAKAIEQGYIYRHFPTRYGGSEQPFDPVAEDIIQTEFAGVGAPLGILGTGPDMLVPTLLQHGTDEQRERFIAPTLCGEITWCQGYSEPGAGSDLASLQSKAELSGDHWHINGQKIWTSDAHRAQWMFGLFRTEPDQPRHGGISYLLLPMDQPGVEVRPLKQMTGDTEFSEVFLDDARTEAKCIVGERGAGWTISRTTLAHERALIGNPRKVLLQFEDLLELARSTTLHGRPAIEDSGIRHRLAEIEGYLLSQKYTRHRLLSSVQKGEERKTATAAMVSKLHTNDIGKRIVKLAQDLLDPEEALRSPDPAVAIFGPAATPGGWSAKYMFSHGSALGGGAPNIQRNIIGERVLGLPRDLRGSGKGN